MRRRRQRAHLWIRASLNNLKLRTQNSEPAVSIHCVHPVQLLCRVAHLSHIVHRSIDELVNEMIISETHENHLGTKKVIVMDDELAARVANHPEAIERLLKEFQAICAPHTQRAFFHLPLILLSYSHPFHPCHTGFKRRSHLGDQPADFFAWL